MRALVIGGGGREEALCYALSRGNHQVFRHSGQSCPWAEEFDCDVETLKPEDFDLVIIGPEAPLADGLADRLRNRGITVFGPGKKGARLESDKAFARAFADRWGLPSPRWQSCTTVEELKRALSGTGPYVVKQQGLAGGKGVTVTPDRQEALNFGTASLQAGMPVVVEEFLTGSELSAIALVDGTNYVILPLSKDHKRAEEGDRGPNTGGMGALATPPWADRALKQRIAEQIFEPALKGLQAEGVNYRGALYAGLMIRGESIKLLEFNARFGDPETQALMPLMPPCFGDLLLATARGELDRAPALETEGHCCCVVIASAHYPTAKDSPSPLTFDSRETDTLVFYASADRKKQLSGSGRNLIVACVGSTPAQAVEKAQRAAATVHFEGAKYRHDIGKQALEEHP